VDIALLILAVVKSERANQEIAHRLKMNVLFVQPILQVQAVIILVFAFVLLVQIVVIVLDQIMSA
jgi:hypothetical protein